MKQFLTLFISLLVIQFSFAQSTLNVKVIDNEKLNMPGATIKLVPGNNIKVTNQSGLAVFQQVIYINTIFMIAAE